MLVLETVFELPCLIINCGFSLSSNIVSRHSQQTKAMLFTEAQRQPWRKHCLNCLLADALIIVHVYSCSFHLCLFFFVFLFGSFCPNMCSASLFSLAIHCLTAEVFFQPFKSCTLKFPAKDNQVCILLSLPALSLCTLSSSPGCLAAPPLGLSLLHTMSHQLSSSRGNWQGGEILNLQNFCFTPLWC